MRNILSSSLLIALSAVAAAPAETPAEVLAASSPDDWRALDPANTLYLDLPSGRVVIELAAQFSPRLIVNLKALVRGGFFDGLAFMLAADVPEAQRMHIDVLRTDTQTFQRLIESRRNRSEPWFKSQAGHVDVCNVPLPVRVARR